MHKADIQPGNGRGCRKTALSRNAGKAGLEHYFAERPRNSWALLNKDLCMANIL
jgi:hypothetical protein